MIQPHFKRRYQDQRWLIYDEQRKYGLYYDLKEIHDKSEAHYFEKMDSLTKKSMAAMDAATKLIEALEEDNKKLKGQL